MCEFGLVHKITSEDYPDAKLKSQARDELSRASRLTTYKARHKYADKNVPERFLGFILLIFLLAFLDIAGAA